MVLVLVIASDANGSPDFIWCERVQRFHLMWTRWTISSDMNSLHNWIWLELVQRIHLMRIGSTDSIGASDANRFNWFNWFNWCELGLNWTVWADLNWFNEVEHSIAFIYPDHFFFKGSTLLNEGGVLISISPRTFWTTQTKQNLRTLRSSKQPLCIHDTANPFSAAMVDTCITAITNTPFGNHQVLFLDGSKDLKNPLIFPAYQSVYSNARRPSYSNQRQKISKFTICMDKK
jgi:hypothetical protein